MISTFIRVSKIEVRNGIKMRSLLPLMNAPVYLTCMCSNWFLTGTILNLVAFYNNLFSWIDIFSSSELAKMS